MKLCDYGCGQEAKYQFKNGKWCCCETHRSCPYIRKSKSTKGKYHKNSNELCIFGCGQIAKYQLKNGRWCCSESFNSCPIMKKKNSIQMKKSRKNLNSKYNSGLYGEKISNGLKKAHKNPGSKFNLKSYKEKRSIKMKKLHKDPNSIFNSNSYKNKLKITIEKIKEKHPIFSKIEEMRYNPDMPIKEREIQIHCKNHECKNSKEKGGWFTPVGQQMSHRIQAIENPMGFGESNFYCSEECKETCSVFRLRSDPLKDNNLPYTPGEKQVYNKTVLKRENGLCEYCGEPAEHVHHIFPKKLEPFFALDPDYGVACCTKHHYKYGHKDECSTGNLAKIVCSVESQKFLSQKL